MELSIQDINNKIYTIRDTKVMIDSDLAKLYQVETHDEVLIYKKIKRTSKKKYQTIS